LSAPGPARLVARPVTPERFADLESIFQARGCSVARNCWCMYYRESGAAPERAHGQTLRQVRREAMKSLIDAGRPVGLIGYRGKTPVGWVSLGPREDYARLARSPVMKPVDDRPVWSVICFVVPAEHRGQGVATELLAAAVGWARRQGVKLLEAYPVDKPARAGDETMWFGAKSMYDKAGFEEVARRKPQRPVVRLKLG
jgi:GNAT superfamily N-acetyltransferase